MSTPSPGTPNCAASSPPSRPRSPPTSLARPTGCWHELNAGSDLEHGRAEFIGAHLRALACAGRKFAGEDVGFVDEVEAYFDVRIAKGDPEQYRQAHAKLDDALGGSRAARRADGRLPRGRGGAARPTGGVHPRVLQRTSRPGARRVPAAGRRNHHLRGGDRQAVVGIQLLPGQLHLDRRRQRRPQAADGQPAATGGPRVLSRATTPNTAGRRPGWSRARDRPNRRSSWSTRRNA